MSGYEKKEGAAVPRASTLARECFCLKIVLFTSSSWEAVLGGLTEMTQWRPDILSPASWATSSPMGGRCAAQWTCPDTTTTKALSY